MHEQQHSSNEEVVSRDKDQQKSKNPKEIIRQIAEQMQIFALENSPQTHSAHREAIQKGTFSQLIQFNNTTLLHVILTVSPADNEGDLPFWHCSMSLIANNENRKAKSFGLWTKREKFIVRDLLQRFLTNRGLKDTQGFTQTTSALHCHRSLSAEEFNSLKGN